MKARPTLTVREFDVCMNIDIDGVHLSYILDINKIRDLQVWLKKAEDIIDENISLCALTPYHRHADTPVV